MNPSIFGLIIIIATLLIYAFCLLLKKKRHLFPRYAQRKMAGKLQSLLARSFEEGEPPHVDVVNADAVNLLTPASIVALDAVEQLANRYSAADEPLHVTSNAGLVHALAKDAAENGYAAADLEMELDRSAIEYAGFTPLSHQSTMLSVLEDRTLPLHLNIGSAGPEIALQDLMFQQSEAILVNSDDLTAQAVGFACGDETAIGEEVFELPNSIHQTGGDDSALLVMDVLRYAFLFAAAAGIVMAFLS